MTASIVLHSYWRSSCSYRVRLGLGAKGLAHDTVTVNLLQGEQNGAEYRAISPTGYVPTLTIDGETFVESMAILELLEELYPSPALLPSTPELRAHVRGLCQIVAAGIQPLQNLNVVRKAASDAAGQKAWMQHFIGKGLAAFEARLAALEARGVAPGPFVLGPSFGMADCVLVPQVYAALRNDVDLTPMPRIRRAVEASKDLPFVKAAHPDAQPDAVK
ncbi:MAG: maleylacetoacetate isomerase [Polyangiaceae bacterium]